MIMKCDCPANTPASKFQNTTYGNSMRVQNPLAANAKATGKRYRCTCCGKVNGG